MSLQDVSEFGIDPDDRVMPYPVFLSLEGFSRDTGDRLRRAGAFEWVEISPGRIGVTVREHKRFRAARTRRGAAERETAA